MGKSGQVPLHTWLPDAMEGPTPVSALIHAATMVAAGVFLVARAYPIFAIGGLQSLPLTAAAWIGGITALYAALVALAQTDIKRILAYSTVSQLGFMMVALGTGGVAAAMFHLIAHAFFKALLFLSAGSVIHGCHEEQDIRRMGGLRQAMPKTFVTYAVGMMALSGFPFVFSGFWSKEAILHGAMNLARRPRAVPVSGNRRAAHRLLHDAPGAAGVLRRAAPARCAPPARKPAGDAGAALCAGRRRGAAVARRHADLAVVRRMDQGRSGHLSCGCPAATRSPAAHRLVAGHRYHRVGASWAVYRNVSSDSTAPDPLAGKLGGVWKFLEQAMGFDALL